MLFMMKLILYSSYFSAMPSFSVCLKSDPVSPIQLFKYSNITLTCTVEFSPAVDVSVTVNTVWTGPAGFITNNTAQPVMGSTTTYVSTHIVRSFNRNKSGKYTCRATVSSVSPDLPSSSQSGTKLITFGKI